MITLIIGPRASGKTQLALEMAAESGRRYGFLCPGKELATEIARISGAETHSIRVKQGDGAWNLIVLTDVHRIGKRQFLDVVSGLKDRGADLIMTACPPATKEGEWIIDLVESGEAHVVRMPRETRLNS